MFFVGFKRSSPFWTTWFCDVNLPLLWYKFCKLSMAVLKLSIQNILLWNLVLKVLNSQMQLILAFYFESVAVLMTPDFLLLLLLLLLIGFSPSRQSMMLKFVGFLFSVLANDC